MVKAILAGTKSQTRRLMKPQPTKIPHAHLSALGGYVPYERHMWPCKADRMMVEVEDFLASKEDPTIAPSFCPHGGIGDRLWVRETFRFASGLDGKSPAKVAEACDAANYSRPWAPIRYEADLATINRRSLPDFGGDWGKARVSIHMPRWVSRIMLEITEVRVERLQDISEADKLAEGATEAMPFGTVWRKLHTNPGERWEDSPWVWVIGFRRLVEAKP
jgi:hypothetical protein